MERKVRVRDPFCQWCGIELSWWRTLALMVYCKVCSKEMFRRHDTLGPMTYEFHERAGMSERR